MIDNLIIGQLPRRILVVLVKNAAFNGSYKLDPLYFQHEDLTFMACYIDGVQFPIKAYQPDFDHNKYSRELMGLVKAVNQNNTSTNMSIDKKSYKQGNTIFAFNFSPDLSNGSDAFGHLSEIKRGSLRLQMKFKCSLPESVNVLVYCEYDNIIEINKDREIFTDYN
jgi:hypothetical protein